MRNAEENNLLLKRVEWLSKLLAYITLVIGVLVLLGWIFHVQWLKSILPGLVSMKVNTALGFILLSIPLIFDHSKKYAEPIFRTLTVFVFILGLLSISEYLFKLDFGIDELIMRDDPGAVQTANLGRMSPMTAITFILLSAAVILFQFPRGGRTAQIVIVSAIALGFISLIGYAYGVKTLFQIYNYTSMAIHTAIIFVLLGLSILLSRPQVGIMKIILSENAGGVMARKILPTAILMPFIIGWIHVETQKLTLLPAGIAEAILDLVIVSMFSIMILWIANILNRADAQREQAEEKLKESEQHFRSVSRYANDAIITADGKGIILGWNYGAEKMFGFNETEVIGKELSLIIPESYVQTHLTGIKRVESGGKRHVVGNTVELHGMTKSGKEFPLELSLAEWETSSGKYFTGIIRDITQRKFAEEEIKKSNEQLKRLNVEKDKFFSIIAHDLKSPFHGLLGLTELMAADPELFSREEFTDNCNSLNESARNLYKLLNNLLEWAQIHNGSINFTPVNLDLRKMVSQCIETIKQTASQKQILIVDAIDKQQKVFADERMVGVVLRNLLSNAIKFTPRGGKIIIKSEETNEGSIKLLVKDNGVGISDKDVKRLFKIEEKVSSQGTEGELSTGLGLLLCKEFIEIHGGEISVESKLGEGSTFSFTIPEINFEKKSTNVLG